MWIRLIVQKGFDFSETKNNIKDILFRSQKMTVHEICFYDEKKQANDRMSHFAQMFSWHLQLVRTQVITDILASFMKNKQNEFQCESFVKL